MYEYVPILALFQRFESFFEARIWIRIRIRVKSRIPIRIRIRIRVMSNPDPHQSDADPQHCEFGKCQGDG
jgi:hypothetical protein